MKNKHKTILRIQEEERNRIARDLHDTSLQDLTYILHKLELLGLEMNNDPVKANMELISIKDCLKNTINDIRNIIYDLKPSIQDDVGLKESIDVFLIWLKNNTNIDFYVDVDNIVAEQIILTNIYRIIVEIVLNSVKHSNGTEIRIVCKNYDNVVNIRIEDNGKGFVIEQSVGRDINYGLSIIFDRVKLLDGTICYDTDIGKGVKVDISIPLAKTVK